ncbi:MAG: universal stress protein [Cyclobacteriaceae bacterium]
MISSILISTDFSPASWNATQVGIELAKQNEEATLSILHIFPSTSQSGDDTPSEFRPRMDQVKAHMNELSKSLLEASEDRIKNIVLAGDVEKAILKFIHQNDFDLVIVGINSNGFDNIPGSHALRVIEKSGTPVMIVPNALANNGAAKS